MASSSDAPAPTLKLLVIGDSASGKTSLIKRFCLGDFDEDLQATVGVDFTLKEVQILGLNVRVQLWDIAGQDRSGGGTMNRVYYQGACGALIVYDITRPATFDGVAKWKADLDAKVLLEDGKSLPAVLIGNKKDLEIAIVDGDFMNRYCGESGFVTWKDTSAKDPEDTEFQSAVSVLIEEIKRHCWHIMFAAEGIASGSASLQQSRFRRHHAVDYVAVSSASSTVYVRFGFIAAQPPQCHCSALSGLQCTAAASSALQYYHHAITLPLAWLYHETSSTAAPGAAQACRAIQIWLAGGFVL
ncbi:P-loop containing nucleoside triphosphate hydrolase protein [Tribonema minus]|uniref:P-loop containing nucleoside triphosphate hydrolase protein n=1 Tax=Tribonema minus TaxID=303371 RepID=A0A836CJ20_9STRA|nr:P-loop containing nucleoside triphosphate hydrolase protein [Tribonema minus]